MKLHRLAVSQSVDAPVNTVYSILADYRVGHPRILPRPPFVSMRVLHGGVGAGTQFELRTRFFGRERLYHGIVSEPHPGRVLVEKYQGTDLVTLFIIEPLDIGEGSNVTIVTDSQVHEGLLGRVEAWFADAMLRRVYKKELRNLAGLGLGFSVLKSA